ncbi:maternal protein tudor-like [Daktulosphaira vitifoliae]|uniref:maternal protein tudor-like n=1 Tax=Daktulosphaira vitifoliae TaxID=58002 RepID=UPI0021AA639F|nr:maternal protein tudor-like [Daktulosphaira vitifoliae]
MIGEKLKAKISYFNSLKDFYVYNSNDLKVIQDISSSFELVKNDLVPLNCIKVGDLVAAQYDDDSLWYRAKVRDIQESYTTVQFIDYGNSDKSSNIRQLPEKLINIKPVIYHCILDDVDSEEKVLFENNSVFEVIHEFMISNEIELEFISNSSPYLVKIVWNNRNLKEILNNVIEFGITPLMNEEPKKTNEDFIKEPVTLVHIKTFNEFYAQTNLLKELKLKIDQEFYSEQLWNPLIDIKYGEVAVGKSVDDNNWYRIRILNTHDDGLYFCYFIDYGIKGTCTDIYEANSFLKSTPPTIIRCKLNISNNIKMLCNNSLLNSFIDEMSLSCNQSVTMSVLKGNEPCLVDIFIDGLSLIDIIKPYPVVVTQVSHINALTLQVMTPGRCKVLCELASAKSLSIVSKPKIGKMYAANINGFWVRVRLVKICPKKLMDVILVDMCGEVSAVHALFGLPKCIQDLKTMMMHGSLGLDEISYSSSKLRKLCDGGKTEFDMIITAHNDIVGHNIVLFKNNINVSRLIKKE